MKEEKKQYCDGNVGMGTSAPARSGLLSFDHHDNAEGNSDPGEGGRPARNRSTSLQEIREGKQEKKT